MKTKFSATINTIRVSHALHSIIVKLAFKKNMSLSKVCASLIEKAVSNGLDKELL